MTPAQAAARFRRMAREARTGAEAVVANTRDDLLATAKRNSSGPLTAADLRRLKHPYARRGGPRLNPAVINKRSGQFLDAWEGTGPTARDGGLDVSAVNHSPHAKFLFDPESAQPDGGTKRMVGRNLPELVRREVYPRFVQRARAWLDRLMG